MLTTKVIMRRLCCLAAVAGLLIFATAADGRAQVSAEKGPDGEVTQTQQPIYKCKVYDDSGNIVQRYQSTEPPPDFDVPDGGDFSCIGGASGGTGSDSGSSQAPVQHLPQSGGPEVTLLVGGFALVYLGVLTRRLTDH